MVNVVDVTGGNRGRGYASYPQGVPSGSHFQIGNSRSMDGMLQMLIQQQAMQMRNDQFNTSQANMMDTVKAQLQQASDNANNQMTMFRDELAARSLEGKRQFGLLQDKMDLAREDSAFGKKLGITNLVQEALHRLKNNELTSAQNKLALFEGDRTEQQTTRNRHVERTKTKINNILDDVNSAYGIAFNRDSSAKDASRAQERVQAGLNTLWDLYNGGSEIEQALLDEMGFVSQQKRFLGDLQGIQRSVGMWDGMTGSPLLSAGGIARELEGHLNRRREPFTNDKLDSVFTIPRSSDAKELRSNIAGMAASPDRLTMDLELLGSVLNNDPDAMGQLQQQVSNMVAQVQDTPVIPEKSRALLAGMVNPGQPAVSPITPSATPAVSVTPDAKNNNQAVTETAGASSIDLSSITDEMMQEFLAGGEDMTGRVTVPSAYY